MLHLPKRFGFYATFTKQTIQLSQQLDEWNADKEALLQNQIRVRLVHTRAREERSPMLLKMINENIHVTSASSIFAKGLITMQR